MSLREATQNKHTAAEQTPLMQSMMDGSISVDMYTNYLTQMYAVYEKLETVAEYNKIFKGMEGLKRCHVIMQDLSELVPLDKIMKTKILPATIKYIEYLNEIVADPVKITAHIYVRHMGDLSGGQMLKDKLPGSGKWYTFDDVDGLKETLRGRLTDKPDFVSEAIKAFDFNIAIFKEIYDGVANDGDSKQSNSGAIG